MNHNIIKSNILLLLKKTQKKQIHLILGLSGGPDSVFLFYKLIPLIKQGLIKLDVAHLDHEWRHDSEDDADFCRSLCEQHAIPFHCAHASDFKESITWNGSREETGRKLRRLFFEKLKEKLNADYICLAHHKDDQLETALIRFTRGTTLQGLTGMRMLKDHYFRPLLSISKEDILSFLAKNHYSFCNDPTNNSHDYLRNRIRHTVIPALQAVDNRFSPKAYDTLAHLNDAEDLLETLTQEKMQELFCEGKGDLNLFHSYHPALQKRILIAYLIVCNVRFSPSNALLNEIIRFLLSPRGGRHHIHSSFAICKKKNYFFVTREK